MYRHHLSPLRFGPSTGSAHRRIGLAQHAQPCTVGVHGAEPVTKARTEDFVVHSKQCGPWQSVKTFGVKTSIPTQRPVFESTVFHGQQWVENEKSTF
jgi:hypothetical protein